MTEDASEVTMVTQRVVVYQRPNRSAVDAHPDPRGTLLNQSWLTPWVVRHHPPWAGCNEYLLVGRIRMALRRTQAAASKPSEIDGYNA